MKNKKTSNFTKSFDPIISNNAKVLILGTIPGKESILKNQYYANPRNQFWDILYSIFDVKNQNEYSDKCKFLCDNEIA